MRVAGCGLTLQPSAFAILADPFHARIASGLPAAAMTDRFRFLPQFNALEGAPVASRNPVDERALEAFPSDSMPDRFARELARRRAVPLKELFESFEFFDRVRRHVRAPLVADVCGGHGLTGVLFALFERRVEQVVVIDRRRPASFERVLEAAASVGPWVPSKVTYRAARLEAAGQELGAGVSIVAVHACGQRTDAALDLALARRTPLAVMPCCYDDSASPAPPALTRHLGGALAHDIDRTYRLERAGYRVRWDVIPSAITPMSRVLIGTPATG